MNINDYCRVAAIPVVQAPKAQKVREGSSRQRQERIAALLRGAQRKCGFETQSAFAKALGYSPSTYSQLLNGKYTARKLNFSDIEKVVILLSGGEVV